ncbi:imelysin family protein [Roseovarius sp.]|uniref:imelysin family protein n=1 Tax=Roseovarius sp. TaxID=1486281 RepID=UPI003BA95B4F
MKRLMAALLIALPLAAPAQDRAGKIRGIVEEEIVGGFAELDRAARRMVEAAGQDCTHPGLHDSYAAAFLAWARVSHLRFGPSEEENRAFALAFWPDPRGRTASAIRKMLADGNEDVLSPEAYADMSIAARGFYALDYLLHEEELAEIGTPDYRCALVRTVVADIHGTTGELAEAWEGFAPMLTEPGGDSPYRTEEEVLQVLYKSAGTGLEFAVDMRLGRPLGTFERPRPNWAEAYRSGLSLALLQAAVRGAGGLAVRLAEGDAALQARLTAELEDFHDSADALDDPVFASVAEPAGRFRVESLQADLQEVREIVQGALGPALGVSAGFNAMDGD